MLILISYDVCVTSEGGPQRLRRIARACQDYGQRVQCSVFEVEVNTAQWIPLKHKLTQLIDPHLDSLRFYYLGQNWKNKVEHVGAKPATDLNGPLIF